MQEAQQPARPPRKADACYPQEFKSAEELRQHYRALKQRMNGSAMKRLKLPEPEPPQPDLPVVEIDEQPTRLEAVEQTASTSSIMSLDEPASLISRGQVLRAVSQAMRLTVQEIQSHCRHTRLVQARFVYYVIARKYSGASLPQIGFTVGYRDHSTVLHGIKQGAKRFEEFLPIYEEACAILKVPVPDVSEYLESRK